METSQTGQGDGLDENVIEGEVPTLARATCAFRTKGARHVSTIQHKVSSRLYESAKAKNLSLMLVPCRCMDGIRGKNHVKIFGIIESPF